MSDDKNFELGSAERKAFESLGREKKPPGFLEDETVNSLKRHGLIRARRPSRRFHPVAVAASLIILFAAGFGLGVFTEKGSFATQEETQPSPEFLLVLWEFPKQESEPTHEEIMNRVREYSLWAKSLQETGNLIAGKKLTDDIRLLGKTGGPLNTSERSFRSVERGIGGYFLIRAESFDQALRIARACPHLRYGGEIELRKIDKL